MSRSEPADARPAHPLVHAGRWIVADLLSTLVFVGLYAASHSLAVSIVAGIGVGVGQIVWLRLRGVKIDAMQWMSLGLVIVFGGATLVTRDPRFIMLKPTLIYAAIGAVMMRRGWMNRYIPPIALEWSADLAVVFGYVWAAMMFATGVANLGLALDGDVRLWAWFLGVFPLASKLALFAIQYLTMRFVTIGRMRSAGALGAPREAMVGTP